MSTLTLADADAHVVEASFMFEVAGAWPEVSFREDGTAGFVIEGRNYPEPTGPGAGVDPAHSFNPRAAPNSVTPEGMLADADTEGVDAMVLFPSGALCAPSIRDRRLAGRFADAYNEWLADFAKQGQGRLFGVAGLGVEHVADAVGSMRRAKDLGLVAAHLPPALAERNLDHPDLDPLYAAAVDLDLPLCVHGAPGMHLPKIGIDRFTNYIQVHAVSFPFDAMAAMTALVSGGVFERHPRLRVLLCESGCGWAPFFVERLGEHWEARGDWIPGGWQRHPREYLDRGNLSLTFESDESMVATVADMLGDHCLMWASDYPHWDGAFPRAAAEFRARADLDDTRKAKLGRDNAVNFFGLRGRAAVEGCPQGQ